LIRENFRIISIDEPGVYQSLLYVTLEGISISFPDPKNWIINDDYVMFRQEIMHIITML